MERQRRCHMVSGVSWVCCLVSPRPYLQLRNSSFSLHSPSPLIHTPTGVVYTSPAADMNTPPCVPYSGQSKSKSTHSTLTNSRFSSTHVQRPLMDRSKPRSIRCRDLLCGRRLGKGRKMQEERRGHAVIRSSVTTAYSHLGRKDRRCGSSMHVRS